MVTQNGYLKFLGQLLRDHYEIIKDTGIPSPELEYFINGYLKAARTLNAVYQKDLNDYIERIHFEVFHMTIEERRKSMPTQSDISENELEMPTYQRKGIKLKF